MKINRRLIQLLKKAPKKVESTQRNGVTSVKEGKPRLYLSLESYKPSPHPDVETRKIRCISRREIREVTSNQIHVVKTGSQPENRKSRKNEYCSWTTIVGIFLPFCRISCSRVEIEK
jgi:hypothetical protein